MAERSGNERGSATSNRTSGWSSALAGRRAFILCLAVCVTHSIPACDKASSAREWPAGTVVAVDEIPISSDEIAQAVAAVLLVEPQWAEVQLKRLAFNEIALPRALMRASVSSRAREAARRSIDEQFALIQSGKQKGPPTSSGAIGHEVSGSWKEIGLLTWGIAMNLERGIWSDVIEVPGAFRRVRVLSRTESPVPVTTQLQLDTIGAVYAAGKTKEIASEAELKKHRLTIVDPAWETIVPERTKYMMGVHKK